MEDNIIILKKEAVETMIKAVFEEELGFVPEYELDKDEDSNDLLIVVKNLNDVQIEKFEHVFGQADEKYLLPLDILEEKLIGMTDIKLVDDEVQVYLGEV